MLELCGFGGVSWIYVGLGFRFEWWLLCDGVVCGCCGLGLVCGYLLFTCLVACIVVALVIEFAVLF